MSSPTANTKAITVPASRLSKSSGDWVCFLVLSAVSLLVMLPVLLHPHWGMFDDASLVLQNCRAFWSDPPHHLEILEWRPGLFALVLLLWKLSPEQPFGYYVFNYLVLTATAILTYRNSMLLSGSRAASLLAAMALFVTSSTFEVIYTVDKQEEFLPLLFAIALSAYLWQLLGRQKNVQKQISASHIQGGLIQWPAMSWLLAASLLAVFTKETGLLLVVAGAVLSGAFVLQKLFVNRATFVQLKEDQQIRLNLAFLLITLCSAVAQKLYSSLSTVLFSYVEINLDPKYLADQMISYGHAIPDFCLLLFFALAATICSYSYMWMNQVNQNRPGSLAKYDITSQTPEELGPKRSQLAPVRQLVASGLAVTCLIGYLGLLSFSTFKSALTYVWFPLYALLLPAVAYFVCGIVSLPSQRTPELSLTNQDASLPDRRARWLMFGVFGTCALLLLVQVPERLAEAQFQFQLDSLAQDLSKELAKRVRTCKTHLTIAFPFYEIGATEIPEHIEYFTLNQLTPGYVESPTQQLNELPLTIFNCLRYSRTGSNAIGLPMGQNGLGKWRGRELNCTSVSPADHVGINGFTLLSGACRSSKWVQMDLQKGALLAIPYGTLPQDRIPFRGANIFKYAWQTKLALFPQMKVKELCKVERSLKDAGGHKRVMGWRLVEIEELADLAWGIELDGWLKNPVTVQYGKSLQGHKLVLYTDQITPESIRIKFDGQSDWQSLQLTHSEKHLSTLEINLPKFADNQNNHSFQLSSPKPLRFPRSPRDLIFHIDEVVIR